MNFLNLPVDVFSADEVLDAGPVELACWVRLLAFCARRENGGVIEGASSWTADAWLKRGIDEMQNAPDQPKLWEINGLDIRVKHYPLETEEFARARRHNGRKGGRPRAKLQVEKPTDNHEVSAEQTLRFGCGEPKCNGKGKGKSNLSTTLDDDTAIVSVLPVGAGGLPARQQRSTRVIQNTPLMVRIGRWFGRQATTLWTVAEAQALDRLGCVDESEIEAIERFYTADIKRLRGPLGWKAGDDFRRRKVETLLNNWPDALDQAQRAHSILKKKSAGGEVLPSRHMEDE